MKKLILILVFISLASCSLLDLESEKHDFVCHEKYIYLTPKRDTIYTIDSYSVIYDVTREDANIFQDQHSSTDTITSACENYMIRISKTNCQITVCPRIK